MHSEQGEVLLKLARDSLHEALGEPAVTQETQSKDILLARCLLSKNPVYSTPTPTLPRPPNRGRERVGECNLNNELISNIPVQDWLMEHGACFVTLTQQGRLRGCIGTLEAHRPLVEDVRANARAAALLDSRFAPLATHELPYTRIEISVLSGMEPLQFEDEDDLLIQLRPHVDGVVLRYGTVRGTFLPQVWQHLPEPESFLSELKQKAGLPARFWSDDIKVYRYTVQKWREQDSLTENAVTA